QHPDLREHVVALAEMRQLMNTDKAEHEIEDPVVPQFASEDRARDQDQAQLSEAKGDENGQEMSADASPVLEDPDGKTIEIEVTEEIKVTETITVSKTEGQTAPGSASEDEVQKGAANAPDTAAEQETAANTGKKRETVPG
ncbi:MAG: hypothetical protein AAGF82_23585, partial [Pseudomonadota bacterium]